MSESKDEFYSWNSYKRSYCLPSTATAAPSSRESPLGFHPGLSSTHLGGRFPTIKFTIIFFYSFHQSIHPFTQPSFHPSILETSRLRVEFDSSQSPWFLSWDSHESRILSAECPHAISRAFGSSPTPMAALHTTFARRIKSRNKLQLHFIQRMHDLLELLFLPCSQSYREKDLREWCQRRRVTRSSRNPRWCLAWGCLRPAAFSPWSSYDRSWSFCVESSRSICSCVPFSSVESLRCALDLYLRLLSRVQSPLVAASTTSRSRTCETIQPTN